MDAVTHLAPTVGIVAACDFLAVAGATFYRQRPVLGPPASPAPEPKGVIYGRKEHSFWNLSKPRLGRTSGGQVNPAGLSESRRLSDASQ